MANVLSINMPMIIAFESLVTDFKTSHQHQGMWTLAKLP